MHNNTTNPRLQAALDCVRRGWPVIPLHGIVSNGQRYRCTCGDQHCKSPGKHPRFAGWQQSTTTDEARICAYWASHRLDNVGLLSGTVSGLLVVDVDPRNGGAKSWQALVAWHGGPVTLTVNTGGGGQHFYFRYPAGQRIACRTNVLPGIDIRAEGGYVVAPGSVHVSGNPYQWTLGKGPDDIALTDAPAWLLELIAANGVAQAQGAAPTVAADDLHVPDEIKRLIGDGDVQGKYPSRSEAVFAVIGALIKAGHPDPEIINVMLNQQYGISEKPREQGEAWLQGEIARARKKPDKLPQRSNSVPVIVCLADVAPEKVEWLWHPYIPLGKVTCLEGDPGLGKSYLLLALAAAISKGSDLPDTLDMEPGKCLLISAEDGLADTIRPRLDALGADMNRIFAFVTPPIADQHGLQMLEQRIVEHTPRLVTIDPLMAFMGGRIDINKANQTRQVLAALASIAEKYRCAIVVLRHITKGGSDRAIYRGIGSIDITAACRSVLLVGVAPGDGNKRVLAHIKSNLAPSGRAQAFQIRDGRFQWTGPVDVTPAQLLAPDVDPEQKSALDEAQEFLRDILKQGPVPAEEIFNEAAKLKIAERTLKRAKKNLGVRSRKRNDKWYWERSDTGPENFDGTLGTLPETQAPCCF
jgi:hypothetical protein